jgi:hypothetical protein
VLANKVPKSSTILAVLFLHTANFINDVESWLFRFTGTLVGWGGIQDW